MVGLSLWFFSKADPASSHHQPSPEGIDNQGPREATLMKTEAATKRFLRNSETSIWRECRLKWYLTFVEGFLTNRVNPAFWLGTLVHLALSEWYLGKTTDPAHLFYEIGRETIEQMRTSAITADGVDLDLDNLAELERWLVVGVAMLEGYQEWDATHRDFDVLDSELSYYVDLDDANGTPFTFVGRFDILTENSEGIRVGDFKTAADFRAMKTIHTDMQFRRYPWMVREAHPQWADQVIGSMWLGLRKIVPSARSKPPYFERVLVDLTEGEYEQVKIEVQAEAADIIALEQVLALDSTDPRQYIYPNPTVDCGWKCDYFRNGLCSVWRAGLDPTNFGDNYGSWGNDPYKEYREDFDGAVTIGLGEGGD
jgi:hypothetical protein